MRAVERSLNSRRRCRAFRSRSSWFAGSVSGAHDRILEMRSAAYRPAYEPALRSTRLTIRVTTFLMNTV